MPINSNLPDIELPVKIKWDEQPQTQFREQLSQIKVKLMYAPSLEDLKSYIPEFGLATWEDEPKDDYTDEEREAAVKDLFDGYILPTAFETINLTFRIEGLDIIDVTHLIRHRTLSFSSQASADRDMRHDDILVKPSILEDDEFSYRFAKICKDAKQLYADMVDSQRVSILDARTILPQARPSFYYVRGNLKDLMMFIRTRLDEQIQPESDNLVAMYMWLEIVKQYPMLKGKIKIGGRDEWYIKTVPTGRSSNIYPPKLENDVFEWKPEWFLYQKRRDEFQGSRTYKVLKRSTIGQIERIEDGSD